MKKYIKEIKLLKKLQREKIPHVVTFSRSNNSNWLNYVTDEVSIPDNKMDVAVIIPASFSGLSEEGFIYSHSVHDKTAEKELYHISKDDLKDYRLKFKNENGEAFQYSNLNFKWYCSLVSITEHDKLGFPYKELKFYRYLMESGKIPFVEIKGKKYVDPEPFLDGKYVFEISRLKSQLNLFGDD